MKLFQVAMISIALTGCATVEQSTRISTPIKAMEYNSVASKYIDRPTFASIEKMSTGEVTLTISRDNYGTSASSVRFSKANIDAYVALVDKFLEWDKLATARGDALTKDIGGADTWGNGMPATLKLTFHSGNASSHYLAISYCAAGTCLDSYALYFDAKNAIELKSQLLKLASSDGMPTPIEDVYK